MNDIDYKAVMEIAESFINNEKVEILGISVGEERQVKQAIKNLIQRNKDLEQIEKERKEENGRLREKVKKYETMIINHKKQLSKSGIYGYDYDLKILEESDK